MKKYINLHSLNKIYISNVNKSTISPDDALFIHNNLYKMDESEKKYLYHKLIKNTHIELLKLEFNDLHLMPSIMSITDFKHVASKMIARYQHKVGGFLLEDISWTLYDYAQNKYKLSKNDIIFENTMPSIHIPKRGSSLKEDIYLLNNYSDIEETFTYLNRLTKILNDIAINIKITMKLLDSYRDDTIFIILYCKSS